MGQFEVDFGPIRGSFGVDFGVGSFDFAQLSMVLKGILLPQVWFPKWLQKGDFITLLSRYGLQDSYERDNLRQLVKPLRTKARSRQAKPLLLI